MIITDGMLKNVEFLRARMNEINRQYKVAFFVGFWFPLAVFVLELFFYYSKLLVLSGVFMHELFLVFEVPDEKQIFAPDILLFLMPLVYMAFSFVSFRIKSRIMKFPLLFIVIGFVGMCVYPIVIGYNEWYTYAIGIIHGIGLFIACVNCIKGDIDEEMLSKIDGYPHFNPVLMHEEKTEEKSLIRFPEKKSNDQLYEEQMELYVKDNPDSETARAYIRAKEEKKEMDIENWLSGMLGKNEENL